MLMSTRHEIFSQNLARIRKQKGLTQADLSKRSGISRRAIVHYENHVAQPPLEKIETLSKALGVNIATLLGTNDKIDQVGDSVFDIRTLRWFRKLVALNRQDRMAIYKMIDAMYQKPEYRLKKQSA